MARSESLPGGYPMGKLRAGAIDAEWLDHLGPVLGRQRTRRLRRPQSYSRYRVLCIPPVFLRPFDDKRRCCEQLSD